MNDPALNRHSRGLRVFLPRQHIYILCRRRMHTQRRSVANPSGDIFDPLT
jgi:hypothetical protein